MLGPQEQWGAEGDSPGGLAAPFVMLREAASLQQAFAWECLQPVVGQGSGILSESFVV